MFYKNGLAIWQFFRYSEDVYFPEEPLPDCPEFEEILDGVTLEDNLETCQQHGENWEADLITRAREADEEPDETDNIPAPAKVSPSEASEHLEKLRSFALQNENECCTMSACAKLNWYPSGGRRLIR